MEINDIRTHAVPFDPALLPHSTSYIFSFYLSTVFLFLLLLFLLIVIRAHSFQSVNSQSLDPYSVIVLNFSTFSPPLHPKIHITVPDHILT